MTLEDFLAFNNQKNPKIILEKEKKAPKADMEIRVTRKIWINLSKFCCIFWRK